MKDIFRKKTDKTHAMLSKMMKNFCKYLKNNNYTKIETHYPNIEGYSVDVKIKKL